MMWLLKWLFTRFLFRDWYYAYYFQVGGQHKQHKIAIIIDYSRTLLIKRVREQNMRGKGAATQPGINTRTAYKWLERYKEGGEAALGT
jgi:hypothetical protein